MRFWLEIVRILSIAGVCLGAVACDRITFSNAPGGEVGAMVDGLKTPGAYIPLNDAGFFTSNSNLKLGRVVSGDSNEAFAFAPGRMPAYSATPWTNGNDRFSMAFANPMELPVTIWIVRGPYADQVAHAEEAILRTTQIWNDERVGLAFGAINFVDATSDPDAPSVVNFPNGDFGDAIGWAPIRAAIGFQAGQLNIYWVDTVNGSTTTGWSNFGAQIAMGRNTGDELLSHEIGHALSLTHINGLPTFDQTNVMHNASNTRAYLTEGQIMRAHTNPTSVLRGLYAYPNMSMPLRNCAINVADNLCPNINRRLWADGGQAANN